MAGEITVVAPAVPAPAPAAPETVPGAAKASEPSASAANGQGSAANKAPEGTKPPEGGEIESAKKEENPADPAKPYKIKVEGKEYSMSLEEMQRFAQKGMGADKRFNDAFKMKQQAENFFKILKTDPMRILNNPKVGLDFKKLAQDFLLQEIEREKMSPEQRELHEVKEKLKAAEDEKKTAATKADQARMQALVQHHSENLEKDITQTLQTSGLPKTADTVRRIAYYMEQGLRRGVELKAADVVSLVRSDYQQAILEMFTATDGETISQMLGDPIINKLLEAQRKKIASGNGLPLKTPEQPADNGNLFADNGTVKKIPKDQWRKELDTKVKRMDGAK